MLEGGRAQEAPPPLYLGSSSLTGERDTQLQMEKGGGFYIQRKRGKLRFQVWSRQQLQQQKQQQQQQQQQQQLPRVRIAQRCSTTAPTTGCGHARYTHARTHVTRTLEGGRAREAPPPLHLGGPSFTGERDTQLQMEKGGEIYFQSKGRKLRFRHGAGGSCSSSSSSSSSSRRAPKEHNGAA